MSLLDLVFGYAPAQVINVAARLGLADQLASGSRTTEELASATGTHPPSLHRLLRALACFDVVAEVAPGRFELTETGRPLRSDVPDSIRHRVMFNVGEEVWRSWGALEYSVRTGQSAWNHEIGSLSWEFFAEHPDKGATFNEAMATATRSMMPAIVAGYDFGRYRTVVDVGGGSGALIAAIVDAYPGVRGILYDLPNAAASARESLGARCEVVEGSFFDGVPAGADAYVLKSIIHDWDDETSVRILRNCRAAGGAVLVVELLLATDMNAAMNDLHMLVLTEGRERTESEYRVLFEAAGLELAEVAGPFEGYAVLAGVPRTE